MIAVLTLIFVSVLILYTAHCIALRVAYAVSGVQQIINPTHKPKEIPRE